MRTATILTTAAMLGLAGCAAPTGDALRVDETGAARAAASPPDLVAVAREFERRQGTRLGDRLTLEGARAEGDVLVIETRHDLTAAEFTPASRDAEVVAFDRSIATQMCAAPATRRFVEEYGGVRAVIVTRDGQPLASRLIDSCA